MRHATSHGFLFIAIIILLLYDILSILELYQLKIMTYTSDK
jgi:hypothetical protein